MTIKAVIFDFDGTIIDTESLWYKAFKEVLREKYQLDLALEEFAKGIGTSDGGLYQYIQTQVRMEINKLEIKQLAHEHYSKHSKTLELREGVEEKLQEAKALGLKIGLASSSDRKWVESYLREFNLLDFFSVMKTKDDVLKVKPDPALYVKTLEELGVEANEALAIEDSLNGAVAAVEAGIKCIVIPNDVTAHLEFPETTIRVESFGKFSFKQFLLV